MDNYFPAYNQDFNHPTDELPSRPQISAPPPFADLYARQMRPVYRYLLARSGEVTAAQTLTVECFESALALYRHQPPAESNLAPWLFRVARARLAAHLRRPRPDSSLASAWVEDSGGSAYEVTDRRLRIVRLAAALRALPGSQPDALALHLFGGLSLADTAAVLRASESGAARLVAQALAAMRQMPPGRLEVSR
jgi:RNA polymerase sigma-70 factor (ECF subfamily)